MRSLFFYLLTKDTLNAVLAHRFDDKACNSTCFLIKFKLIYDKRVTFGNAKILKAPFKLNSSFQCGLPLGQIEADQLIVD